MKYVLNLIRKGITYLFFFKNKKIFFQLDNKIYLGSLNSFNNIMLNFLYPGRLLFKLKYGQVFKKKKNSTEYFNKKIKIYKEFYPNYFDKKKIDEMHFYLEKFLDDGAFLINNYFTKEKINLILKKYSEDIKLIKKINNQISYNMIHLKMDNLTKSFFYDPGVILLIESFYQKNIYARNYPYIKYTSVPSTGFEDLKSKIADDWHVDHVNIGSMFVLLENVEASDTRMQYLPGSHKHHHIGTLFSDDQFKNNKKVDCFGESGSIHFHSGNTVHRAKMKQGSSRLTLYFEYSPGSNILLNSNNIAKSIDGNFDITNDKNLNKLEKNFFKGIYPPVLPKGYELIKNKIIPTRYKGI